MVIRNRSLNLNVRGGFCEAYKYPSFKNLGSLGKNEILHMLQIKRCIALECHEFDANGCLFIEFKYCDATSCPDCNLRYAKKS